MSESIGREYLSRIVTLQETILAEEASAVSAASTMLADQIRADRLVHIYGPGGHSNLASQEVFFRAGGLMHISAILDGGTLLSQGASRSMAMERTPGYGRVVVEDWRLGPDDLLILVNAYGINAALLDAAITATERVAHTIGVSSRQHAVSTAPEHPARHPSGANLHEVVDHHVDTKVPVGDAVMQLPGVDERTGAVSTFAIAFTLNWMVLETVAQLAASGTSVPIWRSGNAPGGDEANARFLDQFRDRVRSL